CAFFEQTYALPATITIKFSYGAMSALGTAQPTPIYANYADVRNALIAQGAPGASTLPANDPESGRLVLSTAEAKALGLDADNSGIDGTVTITSSYGLTFDPNDRAEPGKYDLMGVLEHEIAHIMGRTTRVEVGDGTHSAMDLFRYAAPGILQTGDGPAYFSI